MLRDRFLGVAFGTSGVRGLVADLTDEAVAAYAYAFVKRMRQTGALAAGGSVAVGMDLRPSSPTIVRAAAAALHALGHPVTDLGPLPTPALALHCLTSAMPGLMVTGSHIPFDRNGIKFYGPAGEILKDDEQAISATPLPEWLPGLAESAGALPAISDAAATAYRERYTGFFGPQALQGLRIGLHEHSAVSRDLAAAILEALGATVIRLGRSDTFVPVDTEAVSDADLQQARLWIREYGLDTLVSTDGDGDRPLLFDADGEFVRGDLLGLLCARALGITALAIPISCNTAIEASGIAERVVRTRIGSPYVIDGMNALIADGAPRVAGFEANGGFLLGSPLFGLSALPTRDAMLPIVAVLASAVRSRRSVAALVAGLPHRFTHSDRIRDVPGTVSAILLSRLAEDAGYRKTFFPDKGEIVGMDTTDGIRLTFADGDIVHLRASGNAPELRCYAESRSYGLARALCENTLQRVS